MGSKPKVQTKTPAAAPPPPPPELANPARLLIAKQRTSNSSGVRGLVINRK